MTNATPSSVTGDFLAFVADKAHGNTRLVLEESADQARQMVGDNLWGESCANPRAAANIVLNALRNALEWRSQFMPGLPEHGYLPDDYAEAGRILEDWTNQTSSS